MRYVSSDSVGELFTKVDDLDFIIVGEMHGSNENAPVIQRVIESLLLLSDTLVVAFEWALSSTEQRELRDYVMGGEYLLISPSFFLDSDGRFTHGHSSLLTWIRAYNMSHKHKIDICTFDAYEHGRDRDTVMADNLRSCKDDHPNVPILVETGTIHARKSLFVSEGESITPMGAILKDTHRVYSIFLRYERGEIMVEEIAVDVTRFESQVTGPEGFFDAVVTIPVSTPAQAVTQLTDVQGML